MADIVKPRCPTRKQNGEQCKMGAGFGTDHLGWGQCKFHGGNSPALKTKAAKDMVAARMAAFGTPIDIEPGDALLGEVRRSAGIVQWLERVITEFTQIDLESLRRDARDVLQTMGDQGREVAVWISLYREERKMLREAANLALKSNIAERQVRLAEEQGRLIAHVLQAVLADLELTPDQKKRSNGVVQRHLSAVAGGLAS